MPPIHSTLKFASLLEECKAVCKHPHFQGKINQLLSAEDTDKTGKTIDKNFIYRVTDARRAVQLAVDTIHGMNNGTCEAENTQLCLDLERVGISCRVVGGENKGHRTGKWGYHMMCIVTLDGVPYYYDRSNGEECRVPLSWHLDSVEWRDTFELVCVPGGCVEKPIILDSLL